MTGQHRLERKAANARVARAELLTQPSEREMPGPGSMGGEHPTDDGIGGTGDEGGSN